MTGRDVTRGEGMPSAEQAKLRVLFIGGSFIAALGDLALASGDFRRGTTSLAIGLAAVVLGVKRAQWLTAGAGNAKTTAVTAWYTAGLGLALMGGGAATTVFARDAETRTAEIVLFLFAGVLLWMGVTSLIAALVKARRRNDQSPPPRGRRRDEQKRRSGRQRAG